MSDASEKTPELSKIVSVIMENPDIIERISALMKSEQKAEGDISASESVAAPTDADNGKTTPVYAPESPSSSKRERRSQLLSALKPYVEPKRREAIDSMLAIADILDTIKRR